MKAFQQTPRHGRQGVSLIECILYMFLLSAIGLLGFQILGRLLQIDAIGSHVEDAQRQRVRLERTWRDDIHHAERVIRPGMDGPSDDIELLLDGSRVVYSASDDRSVTRKILRGESLLTIERWDVDGSVRFHRSKEGRLVTLELDAPRGSTSSGDANPSGSGSPDRLQRNFIDASVSTARARSVAFEEKTMPEEPR